MKRTVRHVVWLAFRVAAVGLVATVAFWERLWPALPPPAASAATTSASPGETVGGEAPGTGKAASADGSPPLAELPSPQAAHPLLERGDAAIVAEGCEEIRSTAAPKLAEITRAVLQAASEADSPAALTIDYPGEATIFPPEIVPPVFLWHEPTEQADTWLIDISFSDRSGHIAILSPGSPPPSGRVDPDCMAPTNEIYKPTPYQASARSWTPSKEVWAAIKRRSVDRKTTVTIVGFPGREPGKPVSRGRVSISISSDPVGAPIFYRDVPLAPSVTQRGVIKPLSEDAINLIGWRLRDIGRPESRLLLTDVPTCTNCHSFSADGNTLGMDLDGPQGDKGAYAIAAIAERTVIDGKNVISWNSFKDKPERHKTIGFLSRVSPDGQHVVTTLNEAVYVSNFADFRFLQVFYPTRGILAYYCRASGEIRALPGADDTKYVHCDPVWTPDGKEIVFARAEAKDAYPRDGRLAQRANDPLETPIQYDLYRMPFREGGGGQPEPIAGASNNGMSNNFPKVSPDGKWIVFVKCRNGQLMRPDSTLWIVPLQGGEARLMECNTRLMNSWHSFSPNSRWMVFSSKANTPYTQMFLTHLDESGTASPPVLVPNSTAANRAVNLPEFINRPYDELLSIDIPGLEYLRYGLRGARLVKAGKLEEAIVELDRAVRLQPDFLAGRVEAASNLARMGRLDEAKARLEAVFAFDPDYGRAHAVLGAVLADQGRTEEAMVRFRKAVEVAPSDRLARVGLANLLTEQGNLEEAMVHLQAVIALNPDDAPARLQMGNVLLQRKLPDEAAAQFQRCLEINPRMIDARLRLSKALATQGRFKLAAAHLEKAVAEEPRNLRAVADLAWLLAVCPQADVRNGARAVEHAKRACAMTNHENPVLLDTLAAAYAEAGDYSQAISTVNQALSLLNPQDRLLRPSIRRHLECYRQGKPWRPVTP